MSDRRPSVRRCVDDVSQGQEEGVRETQFAGRRSS
jgi:hypothetical protein